MLKKGDKAPPFPDGVLKTFDGESLDMETLTEEGCVVIVFLRGFS